MNAAGESVSCVPVTRVWANAARRRLWRWFFAPEQARLGAFFLDPRDHIGKERLITGDRYEAVNLQAIDWLVRCLKLERGMAVDGGANIGNHACWMVSRFEHVLCVEPGRVAGLVLEANLAASGRANWEIVHGALGERAGRGCLRITDDVNLGSSQVIPSNKTTGDFTIHSGDSLVAACRRSDLPVTLIKLDIEGAEAVALAGLVRTLVRDQPLICVEALKAQEWADIRGVLEPLGYKLFLTLSRPKPAVPWFDFLRYRRKLTELQDAFPAGGCDMVFCLTPAHARALASPAPTGSPA